MGEKIKDITVLKLHDMDVAIELNDGDANSRSYKTIHIQNERFRLQLKESEYLEMAATLHVAADRLRKIKRLEETS